MELSFNVLTGMAINAVRLGDLDLGEHFCLQALTLAKRVLSAHEEALAEGNLAMCLSRIHARKTESLSHFRRAVSLQEKPGATEIGDAAGIQRHELRSGAMLHRNFAMALSGQGLHTNA